MACCSTLLVPYWGQEAEGVKRFVDSPNFQASLGEGKQEIPGGSRRIQVSALPSLDHPVLLSQLLYNFFLKNRT